MTLARANELVAEIDTRTDDALESMTLEQLASVAESEHGMVELAAEEALAHAIRCGAALLVVWRRYRDKENWHRWANENLSFSSGCAGTYIRICLYKDSLPPEVSTVSGALRGLRGLPPVGRQGRKPHEAQTVAEAKRLRAEGFPLRTVADMLGVAPQTVSRWTVPGARAKAQQATKRSARRRREAARALAEQQKRDEQRRLAAQAGGSLEKVYLHFRKMADEIPRAIEAATSPEEREALRGAEQATIRVEAQIGAALAASRRT